MKTTFLYFPGMFENPAKAMKTLMGSIDHNPDVNTRDFKINHLLLWLGCVQIFPSESPYSCSYKSLL